MIKTLAWLLLVLPISYTQSKPLLRTIDFDENPRALYARGCCGFGYDLSLAYLPIYSMFNIVDMQSFAGDHQYSGSMTSEENGLMYTCNGGFIDTAHLRDAIDQTAWVAQHLVELIRGGGSVEFPTDGTFSTTLYINRQRSNVSDYVIAQTAARIVFEYLAWHEIATWYDHSEILLFSERLSAFSIEDLYSNLLGVSIGASVLLREGDYEKVVNEEIQKAMEFFDPVLVEDTKLALDLVEGVDKWWDKESTDLPNDNLLRRRYMQYSDVYAPWKVPDHPACVDSSVDSKFQEILLLPENAESYELKNFYNLVFDVDLEEVPIPSNLMPGSDNEIDSRYFQGLIEKIKKSAIKTYGEKYFTPGL